MEMERERQSQFLKRHGDFYNELVLRLGEVIRGLQGAVEDRLERDAARVEAREERQLAAHRLAFEVVEDVAERDGLCCRESRREEGGREERREETSGCRHAG